MRLVGLEILTETIGFKGNINGDRVVQSSDFPVTIDGAVMPRESELPPDIRRSFHSKSDGVTL